MAIALFAALASLSVKAHANASAVPLRLTAAQRHAILTLKPLNDRALHVRALHGHPVVVAFFASWCGPCRAELATLTDLYPQLHARGVQLVAVNAHENFEGADPARMRTLLDTLDPPFPVLSQAPTSTLKLFGGIPAIPDLFAYDATGALDLHLAGGTSRADLVAELNML